MECSSFQKVSSTEANSGLSPATKNRLASLFQSFPKFGKSRTNKEENKNKRGGGRTAEENDCGDEFSPRSPPVIGGGLSRGGSYSANSSPAKSATSGAGSGPPPLSRPPSGLQRTRSMSSDNGFSSSRGCSERGSYRGGRGTTSSRYMQAAEAYKYKTLNATPSGSTTWSAASAMKSSRARPSLGADTFQPLPSSSTSSSDVRASSQKAAGSSSPAIHRRQPTRSAHNIAKDHHSFESSAGIVTSTHSTPSRKPPQRQRSTTREHLHNSGGGGSGSSRSGGDMETDEMILRRMEEILFTYKSKLEDRLAAEGKELPKDIFDDFTEHWVVNSAPYRAKSVDSLDSTDRWDGGGGGQQHQHHNSKGNGGRLLPPPASPKMAVRGPSTRKDPKEGHRVTTRIPVPTYYGRSPMT